MAATDTSGFPTSPAANELIESAWGAAIRNRVLVTAGSAEWPDTVAIGNGLFDLFSCTIATQQVAVTVHAWVTWQARVSGGGNMAGDVQTLGTLARLPTNGIGPVGLNTDVNLWTTMSVPITYAVAAGANPGYKVRATMAGMSVAAHVYAASQWIVALL